VQRPARRRHGEAEPVQRRRQVGRADVRVGVDRICDRALRGRHQLGTAAIVEVDDRDRTFRQQLEQSSLGREVVVHVAVEIEVIAGEIREDSGRELQVVRALQRQRVRRHLHHAGAAALRDHVPHHRLELGRLRRRSLCFELPAADPVSDGSNPPAGDSSGLED
jgi:hypothetical protein